MFNFRERSTWLSVLRFQTAIAFLLILVWGAVYLHKGWNSVWRNQATVVAKQTYVPPVDPVLAKDPSVQAAKMKAIGPLASKLQEPDANADFNSAVSEPAPSESAPAATPSTVDLVKGFRELPPMRLFRGRMSVKGYRDLQFEIPPHASFPRVLGSYKQLGGARCRSAGLLLLSEPQFRDFLRGNSGNAVFTNEGPSGTIDVALSPTRLEAQKYHLLLRNSSLAGVPVEADFTVSFD